MKIEFGNDLLTGNCEIDGQHLHLIELANRLNSMIEHGSNEDERRAALDSLVRYVDLHFAAEQQVMTESNFPGMRRHLAQHEDFKLAIGLVVTRHQAGEEVTVIAMHQLVAEWFLDHIRTYDKALAQHVQKSAAVLPDTRRQGCAERRCTVSMESCRSTALPSVLPELPKS